MNTEFYCDPIYGGCGAPPNEPCTVECTKADAAREEILSALTDPVTKTPPQLYVASLYRFPTFGEQCRVPLMWASTTIPAHYMSPNTSSRHTFNPYQGRSSTYYALSINYPRRDIMPGWVQVRIDLQIDQQTLGDDVRQYPINIYDAEPTDINTGLVRFPPTPIYNHRSNPNQASDGVVWMLGMRRAQ